MKRALLMLGVFAMVGMVCVGCKKSSSGLVIQGNWELTQTSDMSGITTFPAGNGNTYQFEGNNYSRYMDGTLSASGRFSIVKDDSASVSRLAGHITFENPAATYWFYLLDDNTLVIDFFSAADGPINTYTRR